MAVARMRAAVVLAGLLLSACGGGGGSSGGAAASYGEPGDLRFTEAHPAEGWVELANAGVAPVRLKGLTVELTAGARSLRKLPGRVLGPEERIVVEFPPPLPPGGARLLDAGQRTRAVCHWPALPAGAGWALDPDGAWRATEDPTPGFPNRAPALPLLINEVCPGNESSYPNPDVPGAFDDWLEIANPSSTDRDAGGVRLAVLPDGPEWLLPAGLPVPGEGRLILHLDGRRDALGGAHGPFVLPSGGASLALRAPDGSLLDAVVFADPGDDAAAGRFEDGSGAWVIFAGPTPGRPNRKGEIAGLGDDAHRNGPPAPEQVFSMAEVRRMDLTIGEAGLSALARNLAEQAPLPGDERDFLYVDCRVEYLGRTWEHVGVRYKGNFSVEPWFRGILKLKMKLDFDEFEDVWPEVNNQRCFGLKKLNLHTGPEDPSFLRELLTLELLRDLGAPASLAGPVRLFVNGGYRGLYALVEEVDDKFLEHRFGNDDGNLYKPEGEGADLTAFVRESYEKETNEDEADWSDVEELIRLLGDPSSDPREYLDLDSVLPWLAVSAAVCNLDSYLAAKQNYYIYDDPALGRWRFVGWDHDLSFAGYLPIPRGVTADNVHLLDPLRPTLGARPLVDRVLDLPELRERYLGLLRDLLDGPLSATTFEARARALQDLVRPFVVGPEGERFPYTLLADPADFDRSLTASVPPFGPDRTLGLLEFLERRRPVLEAALR